jgi:hypothetical protein
MSASVCQASFPPLQKGGEGGFIGDGELIAAGRNPPRPPFFKVGSIAFVEACHVSRP